MSFLDDLLRMGQGIGKGVGTVAEAAWKASPPGRTLHRMDRADMQNDLRNDFQILQQIQNPDDQREHLIKIAKKYPKLVQLSEQMSSVATQTQQQQREAEKWRLLDETEKKDLALRDQWGRRPQGEQEADPLKKAKTLLDIRNTLGGEEDEKGNKLADDLLQQAQSLLFPPEERLPEGQEPGRYQFISPGIPARDTYNDPIQPRTPTPIPTQTGGHSFSPGAAPPAPVDNRHLFIDDENPFLTPLTPESRAKVESFLDEDLSPAATAPAKQSPHTFEDIGIIQVGQQKEFQELEKTVQSQMPDFDMRQSYALHPESYKKLFAAIRNGVPDQKKGGTRKLTTAEIMMAIQSMGR